MTMKSFPKPSDLPVPAGAEGWEEIYPYYLVFQDELKEQEDAKFWFCDSQHWPTVFKPFETIGGEFAVKCLGQYNARHLMIPNANGIDFRIHQGYLYMSPIPVPDEQIAARVPEFEARIGHYFGDWENKLAAAIAKVKVIFERLREEDGITLQMINMGGGFPANYIQRTNDLETYAEEITRFLKEDFGDDLPEIILEPGRSLIANAGVLVSEVVLVARKSRTAVERWVYADVGKFSGLIETMDEAIKFPIWTEKKGEMEEVVIAGPTCDSADIMYENYKYGLPLNLSSGDRLYWLSTGAYTTSYSAVEFNGFPPLKSYYL